MINTLLLKSKIYENGFKRVSDVAERLGMANQTFSNKMNNNVRAAGYFSLKQVRDLKEILHLTPEEIDIIFFN